MVSVCLPSDALLQHLPSSLGFSYLGVGYLLTAAPGKHSRCSLPWTRGKPLQYSCLENPMKSMKRQSDWILKEKLPKLVGAQYATGNQWRNNSRKHEGLEPKQKQHLVVNGTGDGSRVQCCKEQYCIRTWNVRSMNQGKLEVVKQDGKSEHRNSRNQRTKMDWNG